MLIDIPGKFYDSAVVAAFSGAAIYTLIQETFYGLSKSIIFLVSFVMGIEGADTTVSLIGVWFPGAIDIERPVGAFLCSVLIVKIAMIVISRAETFSGKDDSK